MLDGVGAMIPCASCLPAIPQKPLRNPQRQSCRRDPRKYDAEVLLVIKGRFTGPGESPLYYLKNFGIIFSWITAAGLALWVAQWFLRNRRQAARAGDHRTDPAEHLKQNRLRAFDAFLWGWAAVLLLFFSALRHKEARYVMPLAPPLFLLAGSCPRLVS